MAGERLDLGSAVGVTIPPAVRTARAATHEQLQGFVLLLAVFLTCGLSPMQGDTWWQLKAGRDMWVFRQVLLTDVYSHTAPGAFWSNHEWFAEVVFYALYRVGGLPLLTVFAATLIAGGWVFVWRLTRGSSTTAFVLMLMAIVASAGWWEPRPHAFSLLFIPWTVWLLHRGAIGWLPPLFLIWANSHGGVLLGFVLVATGLAARTTALPSLWFKSLLALVVVALAMTATPLGVGFWIEIPRSLSRISLYPLDEWNRPELTDPTMIPFWGIAATYGWELIRQRHRIRRFSPADAALHSCALILLPGAAGAVRNVGPFLMLSVPALTHLWAFESRPERTEPDRIQARIAFAVMIAASVAVVGTLGTAYRDRWARLRWDPITAPAIAALRDCPDNLYNRYDEGGMLLWFSPGRRVFLDGRQDPFPPALVLEHIEMETGQRGYEPTFDRHDIRCAFLPVVSPVAAQLTDDGWTALFRDHQWVVLRKR